MTAAYRDATLATSATATLTLTIPASAQAGDLLVAWSSSFYDVQPSYVAGWDCAGQATGNNMCLWTATRRCQAGDPGATVALAMAGTGSCEGGIAAFSGTLPVLASLVLQRASSGSAGTLAAAALNPSVLLYAGAARVGSTTVSLAHGTVDAQRAADTNIGSVTGHEAFTANGPVAQTFTATPSGNSGYGYLVAAIIEQADLVGDLKDLPVQQKGAVTPAGNLIKGRLTYTDDQQPGG